MFEASAVWELVLRGAVAGLLTFHLTHLVFTKANPAARSALAGFALSILAYLFCSLPPQFALPTGWLSWPVLALCVSSTALMWLAARAVFDDHFRFSLSIVVLITLAILLGLLAHRPGDSEAVVVGARRWVRDGHALAMLCFGAAALWEIGRGWRADLVEPRRTARRWVAMVISLYAMLVLVIELALRDRSIDRSLPTLHVATIGVIALMLALIVTRRPLAELLGAEDASVLAVKPLPTTPPAELPPPGRESKLLTDLRRLMTEDRAYRREGLTLAGLAETLRTSDSTLRALINQRLGYRNFNDFLHHYRLQEASARLRSEDLPILTIALECGYGSIGPFNRAFKQRMGATPTEYRAADRVSKARSTN